MMSIWWVCCEYMYHRYSSSRSLLCRFHPQLLNILEHVWAYLSSTSAVLVGPQPRGCGACRAGGRGRIGLPRPGSLSVRWSHLRTATWRRKHVVVVPYGTPEIRFGRVALSVKHHVHVVILCHFMSFYVFQFVVECNFESFWRVQRSVYHPCWDIAGEVYSWWCLGRLSDSMKWVSQRRLSLNKTSAVEVCLRQQSQFDPSNTLAPLPTCGRICLWRHWDALSLNCTCNCLQANHLSLHLKCLHISTGQKQGQKCGQDCKLKPSINTTSRISPKCIPRAWRTPFHGLQARQNTFYSIELCIPQTSLLAYINLSKLPIASSISTLVYLSYGLLLCTFHNMTIRCTTSRANKTSWGRYSRLRSRGELSSCRHWQMSYIPTSHLRALKTAFEEISSFQKSEFDCRHHDATHQNSEIALHPIMSSCKF